MLSGVRFGGHYFDGARIAEHSWIPAILAPRRRPRGAAVANAIDKTNERIARLTIRHNFFILVGIISLRVTPAILQTIAHCVRCQMCWASGDYLARAAQPISGGLDLDSQRACTLGLQPPDIGGSLSMDSKQIPV